ncbi:MAG: Enoyl-CoA hydratase/isomerase [Marmoricola sp.]|nr:Enoyl-CoA hydratase/isomerase [Marmoricola sp.]
MNLCLLELSRPVATITLNRPAAKNALNIDLLNALIECLEECSNAGVTVLVLRAEGTAFCAGADLRSDDGTLLGRPGLRRDLIERAIELVGSFPVSVAVVQGPAVGGGWGLAFAADVVLATADALFKFPELALGFLPPEPIVRRFHEVAGPVRSLRLLGSGESFRADDPALAGLVEVAAPALLADRANELADLFSRSAPCLLRVLKQSLSSLTVHERPTS